MLFVAHSSQLQGRVQLDVGGARFFTSRATLSAKPGFFRALCEGFSSIELDQDGCVFIDRDATSFRYVLLFLQNQAIALDALTKSELETLELDADFYELEELCDEICAFNAPAPITEVSCQFCGTGNRLGTQSCSKCGRQLVAEKAEDVMRRRVTRKQGRAHASFGEDELHGVSSVKDEPHFVQSVLQSQLALIEKEIEAARSAVEEQRANFVREKGSFTRLQGKISSAVCNEKIKLQLMNANVRFCTSIKTLTSKPGSFFASKFGSVDRW